MLRFIKDFIRQIRVIIIQCLLHRSTSLQLKDKILIVAPHPDDEVLGCSGLIQRMIEMGNKYMLSFYPEEERAIKLVATLMNQY